MLIIILITIACTELTIANMLQLNPDASLDFRIIDGDEPEDGQFPWHVYLFMGTKYNTYNTCGGSLIANEWVITAAHCTTDAEKITISLGSKNKYKFEFITHSKRIYNHNDYNPELLHNDIALIQLDESVTRSDLIKPISLPPLSEDFIQSGDIAETCGFGSIDCLNNTYSDNLLWIKVRIETNEKCMETYGPKVFPQSKMCGQSVKSTQNTCVGDSGGGLVIEKNGEKYLIGIISFGSEENCLGVPDGYEKVSPHLDWITEIMDSHN